MVCGRRDPAVALPREGMLWAGEVGSMRGPPPGAIVRSGRARRLATRQRLRGCIAEVYGPMPSVKGVGRRGWCDGATWGRSGVSTKPSCHAPGTGESTASGAGRRAAAGLPALPSLRGSGVLGPQRPDGDRGAMDRDAPMVQPSLLCRAAHDTIIRLPMVWWGMWTSSASKHRRPGQSSTPCPVTIGPR